MNDAISAMPADRTAVQKTAGSSKLERPRTIIEGFDFLDYGTAAALVFNHLYFPSGHGDTGSIWRLCSGFLCAPDWRYALWSFWRSRRAKGNAFAQPAADGDRDGADRAAANLRANRYLGAGSAGHPAARAEGFLWWRAGGRHAHGRRTCACSAERAFRQSSPDGPLLDRCRPPGPLHW